MILLTKKRTLILGIIGILVAGFFTARALGGTTVGVSTISGTGRINSNSDLDSGLVGHWTMDSGNLGPLVMDSSSSGYHGNLVQTSTTTVLGKKREALDLSGSGEYVNLGDVLDMGTSDWTASAWFKTTDTTFNLISKSLLGGTQGRWALLYDSTQWLVFMEGNAVRNFTYASSAELDDRWHLATATWDRDGNETLYIDGVSVGTPVDISADNGLDMQNANVTLIGRYQDGSGGAGYEGYDLNGSIDDVRVYNRVLSASEVARLYKQSAPSYVNKTVSTNSNLSSGLVGHWTFDGPNMATNVADSSGQGNHGSLIGQASTTTVPGRIGQGLYFDGLDDRVSLGSGAPLNIDNNFTIAAWIKVPTGAPTTGMAVAAWGEDSVGKRRSMIVWNGGSGPNKLYWSGYGANVAGTTNIADGQWHHAVITLSSSDLATVYLDSVSENSGSVSLAAYTYSGSYIGDTPLVGDAISEYFNGTIDDVRIYNRVLSTSEISELYNLGH